MSVASTLTPDVLARVQAELARLRLDGWLLFDFHGLNPVATRVLGLSGLATRRLFVLLPARGTPIALAHRIEAGRVEGFPGEVRVFSAWRELEAELRRLVGGLRVAMEYSAGDKVPYLDRIPAGVLELVRASGAAEVVSSSELVSAVAARWSPAELAGHRRAAGQLREIALAAFAQVRAWHAAGEPCTEQRLQQWVLEQFARHGLATNDPPIVGVDAHAANPHYETAHGPETPIGPGQVLLLDLWAGPGLDSVFADQTWMAFTGTTPPEEVRRVWRTVRDARDRAVSVLRERWGREPVTGADLDDAARGVIRDAGYGEHFVHRTGHSIDRELHGSGPHLDNYETSDNRVLVPGVGFSVEPGVYLAGRFGVRSEINVVLHQEGPEVTPAEPQQELVILDLALGV